jgi:large subunit ribosomal protein L25
MLALKAKIRDVKENLDSLRASGELPAVFYGMGNESTRISVSKIEFKKIWRKAGESSTIKITTPKTTIDTLIHEVQVNPVTDEPIHVDFLAIDINKAIKVKVPLEFSGASEAVKSGLGTLVKVLHEIEVEGLPKDLPHSFIIDISSLVGLDDQILVSDIIPPKDVKIITKVEEVVASVAEQKEEKIEEPAPIDLSTIVVEKKGKKEEEGAEGAEETEAPAKEAKSEKK